MDRWIEEIVTGLQEGHAADVAGSRGAFDVLVSERLLNRAIVERLPAGGAVKDVIVAIASGEVRVTVRLARPRFVPPVTVPVTIERQPDLPASPLIVLRLQMPPGLRLLGWLGANLFHALPPGLKLEGDRLTADLAVLLRDQKLDWILSYARSLAVTFEDGRVRIQGSAAID